MNFSAKSLLDGLPQTNSSDQLTEQWLKYYKFYGFAELLDKYQVAIGCLTQGRQQTIYQHFSLPITNSAPGESLNRIEPQQLRAKKGTCIIVHGFMDHSGLFSHLIKDQLAQGWDVLIYDKIGHGLSSGTQYAIADFSLYAVQLEQVLEYLAGTQNVEEGKTRQGEITPAENWRLIGQSTGATVIMEQALNPELQNFQQVKQRLLLAPLLRSHRHLRVKFMYWLLGSFLQHIPRGSSVNSHDREFLTFITEQDPFSGAKIPVSWVGAMLKWQEKFLSQPRCSLPITIIQGDDDDTVDWRYNLKAIRQQFPNGQQYMVAGAKHHLVNEKKYWREQVLQLIKEIDTTAERL